MRDPQGAIPAVYPVVIKLSDVAAASKRNHSIGAADGPVHAGALEAGGNDSFATRFNDTRTYEESLATELGITHPFRVTFEVVRLDSNRCRQLGIVWRICP